MVRVVGGGIGPFVARGRGLGLACRMGVMGIGSGSSRAICSATSGGTASSSSKSSPSPRACSSGGQPSRDDWTWGVGRDGDCGEVEHRAAVACFGKARGVDGQAVANVDPCVQRVFLVEQQGLAAPGLDLQMPTEQAAAQLAGHEQAGRRAGRRRVAVGPERSWPRAP